jgi:hypothetical protein
MYEKDQLNDVASIALWAIRRLPSGHQKIFILKDLKKTLGSDHEYIPFIDNWIEEISENKDVL